MAFNKSKALESALKYLNQGRVNQAIAEYQQILRNDPKDQATLMTVGDLFARQGDMSHALEYFERLAQVYLADGFNSKAIAIYKKIAKLAPLELSPLEKLADLYVQQGVLSEARPLFLQIAEAHLKAHRAPKAVEVLHRLLEVEPENPRVQMRLAELYNVMGQKVDAAKTYLGYGQRLFDRGDHAESEKLVERALEVAPGDSCALLLKAKILASTGKDAGAIKILEKHPEADAGTEVTNLLVDLELKTGQIEAASDRARNQLVRGNSHFGLLFRVSETLVEKGQAEEALPLFRELRDPMIEVGEHDKFVKSLSGATERLPGNTEALELLADFCRHTSDPFPLTVALTQLADIYEAAGNNERVEQLLEELVDRNRDNEGLAARLASVRIRNGKLPKSESEPAAPPNPDSICLAPTHQQRDSSADAPANQDVLDPETRHYIAQALTDVDLFSSYGLAQKAANLLEAVLQRAPRHAPTLERLLDLSVGAGDDPRTAQLAATLEQIYRERNDGTNAERFAQLRKSFQNAADAPGDRPQTPGDAISVPALPGTHTVEPASAGAVPVDMEPESQETETKEFEISPETPAEQSQPSAQPAGLAEEVDLSDEWEAMVQEVVEPPPPAIVEASTLPPAEPLIAALETAETIDLESAFEPEAAASLSLEPEVYEIHEEAAEEQPAAAELFGFADPLAPEAPSADEAAAESAEFELELTPAPSEAGEKKGASTTEDFIGELALEVDGLELPAPVNSDPPGGIGGKISLPAAAQTSEPAGSALATEPKAESLNELSEVFQEFRDELGELGEEEDEDLETHYNLGIAYREMGLLDEAIGEFQKVAKAVQKGKPFRYAMNCAVLLALSFADKGEPKIAALWYKRALEVPGLEQETILALRYDLGISLETSGDSDEALDCFRQVYAMNIDYRDVSDRIATLQHH
ncbi:MAG: tetratricopeptide repeat protein [Candidatus Acidiferrales bacterium]|jgi:tetratricopeptide (TPR) repeat protein